MGKIVAVWSEQKNAGKSVTTYMLAKQIKEMGKKDIKILVCCLNFKYSLLYKLLHIDVSATGLEDLVNFQAFSSDPSGNLESVVPHSQGLYFLGSYRTTNAFAQKNIDGFYKLLEELQSRFDLIIFDTVSGRENVVTNLVLQKAHVVLRLFVQDNDSMRELTGVEESTGSYNQETIYVVSKYRDIYPRRNDIARRFALKKVYTMDYCETLQEMKNRDSLHLYLQRETSCNNSIKRITSDVLSVLNLLPQEGGVREQSIKYMMSRISSMIFGG